VRPHITILTFSLLAACGLVGTVGAQQRVRVIARVYTQPGAVEVLARSSDGVHVGLWDGVFTYNCGTGRDTALVRTWIAGARALADTNVAVAKNEVVILNAGYLPGCWFDLTREATGRGGIFHFSSSTDYGAGSINLRTDRKGFLKFLVGLDSAIAAASQIGIAGPE
jgi:hypothetical protein